MSYRKENERAQEDSGPQAKKRIDVGLHGRPPVEATEVYITITEFLICAKLFDAWQAVVVGPSLIQVRGPGFLAEARARVISVVEERQDHASPP